MACYSKWFACTFCGRAIYTIRYARQPQKDGLAGYLQKGETLVFCNKKCFEAAK